MKAKIIRIGNSRGIMLSKQLISQYEFETEIEIVPKKEGLLLKAARPEPRSGWEAQFAAAIAKEQLPEGELLEDFGNDFDQKEWQW